MDSITEPAGSRRIAVRSGFLPDRIIHLHPTLNCNLACEHCYSDSAPGKSVALEPSVLNEALELLRNEGYEQISFSGGEPLFYKALAEVFERAKSLGYRMTLITNGYLVTPRRMPLLANFDGIAVSFDGMRHSHNRTRGRNDAFDKASAAVELLAAEGLPVAAAISLTRHAIPELPDLADHLANAGARALQIRPVARAGRAQSLAESGFYRAADRARLYLVVLALQNELQDQLKIRCDLAPAGALWNQREDYAALLGRRCEVGCSHGPVLSDLINPLVITETGTLKPIAYDFDPRFDIAAVDDLLSDKLSDYRESSLPVFQDLIGSALASLRNSRELIDWFDYCTRKSETWDGGTEIPIRIGI